MLGFYNYTVILTYLGMLTGFVGITLTYSGNTRAALACLMIAGVCDMFDGKIASTRERTRQEKRFGVQIDSLSDLICFGLLPALIVYSDGSGRLLRLVPCALYVICALIRLAWFNVDEEERQDREGGRRKYYLGLPVTCIALILPVLMSLGMKFGWPMDRLSPLVLVLTAAAFLAPFRVRKPSLPGEDDFTMCASCEDEMETDRPAEA